MAGSEINLYGVGDVDLTALMNTVDLQRVTFQGLSLTNYDNTALPAIAAGSLVEVAGALFKFTAEEAITGWGAIANDTAAYIKLVPAGTDPDTVTAEFTDTAPTWSDAKQGWYGTGGSANHKYVATLDKVDAATYATKDVYNGRYGERPMRSRVRVTKNNAQSIPNASATIVQYDDEDYDNLGEFATYEFTAKESGYYSVAAGLLSAAAEWDVLEIWQIILYKNNAAITSGYQNVINEFQSSIVKHSFLADIIYLAATDYIDIRCYQTQGAGVNTSADATYNYFAVHRLS